MNKSNKKIQIVFMFFALLISILFFLPKFFDITRYNEIISSQIEAKTGLYIKAKGSTNFSILPKVRVNLKDITVNISDPDDKNNLIKLGDGSGLFFEISLMNLIKGDFNSIDKVILSGANFDMASFDKENKDYIVDLLNEKLEFSKVDSTIYLEDSNIKINFLDDFRELNNINAKVNFKNKKVVVLGDGIYNNLNFNLDSTVILKDMYNISGKTKIFYKDKRLDYGLDFKFNKDYTNSLVQGDFYFKKIKNDNLSGILSNDLISRLKDLNKKDKMRFSGGFQYSNGNFRINSAKLDSGANSGLIDYYYNKSIKRHSLGLDIKNLYLNDKDGVARDGISDFLKHYNNFYINSKVRFLHLNKDMGLVNDLEFKLNNQNGIQIKDLSFKSPKFKNFSFNGVLNENDIEGSVELSPGHGFGSDFLKKIDFKSLKGSVIYDFNEIHLYDTVFLIGSDKARGDILVNKDEVDIRISSKNISLNNICNNNILECLSQNLNLYNSKKNISVRGLFDSVKYNNSDYKDINLDVYLNNDELKIQSLSFSDVDNIVNIDGLIKGFSLGVKKSFDNLFFDIEVKDFSKFKLYNLSLPFLKNVLKDKPGNIKMNIDGDVSNPVVDISGIGEDIEFSLNSIISSRDSSSIDMNFAIDDFREFLNNYNLKSSALKNINTNLVKDDVSLNMKVSLDSETGYISSLGIEKDGDNLNIGISFSDEKPIIKISSDSIDLGSFIKKSSMPYKSDILVYILNSLGGDLQVSIGTVKDYDDIYKNLSLSRGIDDGLLKMSYNKNGTVDFLIDGYYDSSIGFDGNLSIKSFIKDRMFNSETLDISNINIDLNSKIKFFGKKYDEIIANLSSEFELNIDGGNLIGISSKDLIQETLSSEGRITYSLLERFLSEIPITGRSDISNINIRGNILDGELKDCVLDADLNNIFLSGSLMGDLKAKMLGFNGGYQVKNFYDSYELNGTLSFGGFLKGEINKELEIENNLREIPIIRIKNFYN